MHAEKHGMGKPRAAVLAGGVDAFILLWVVRCRQAFS
jgi:hypothetical protein